MSLKHDVRILLESRDKNTCQISNLIYRINMQCNWAYFIIYVLYDNNLVPNLYKTVFSKVISSERQDNSFRM